MLACGQPVLGEPKEKQIKQHPSMRSLLNTLLPRRTAASFNEAPQGTGAKRCSLWVAGFTTSSASADALPAPVAEDVSSEL